MHKPKILIMDSLESIAASLTISKSFMMLPLDTKEDMIKYIETMDEKYMTSIVIENIGRVVNEYISMIELLRGINPRIILSGNRRIKKLIGIFPILESTLAVREKVEYKNGDIIERIDFKEVLGRGTYGQINAVDVISEENRDLLRYPCVSKFCYSDDVTNGICEISCMLYCQSTARMIDYVIF